MVYEHDAKVSKPTREGAPAAQPSSWRMQLKEALRGRGYENAQARLRPKDGTGAGAPAPVAPVWTGGQTGDYDDPALRERHRDPKHEEYSGDIKYSRQSGVAFVNGVSPADVLQGAIADCYFVAALAAVAKTDPGILTGGVKDLGGGKFQVRLYQKQTESSGGFLGIGATTVTSFTPKWIDVDADLPSYEGGTVAYSRSGETDKAGKKELWVSLFEKAYAVFRGGYDKIGEGGDGTTAMEAITGASATEALTTCDADSLFGKITKAIADGHPVTAGTYGKDKDKLYQGKGIYSWHRYTVMSASVDEKRQKWVKLRNPWGVRANHGDLPEGESNDAVFDLRYEDFRRYYKDITFGGC